MNDKKRGIYRKYEVKKLSNLTKEVDAIVLEFDDELSWKAIHAWANIMLEAGYEKVFDETMIKLKQYKNAR